MICYDPMAMTATATKRKPISSAHVIGHKQNWSKHQVVDEIDERLTGGRMPGG
jgi:hypothetical protein